MLQDCYVVFPQKIVLSKESLLEKESFMKFQFINRCKWSCSAEVEIRMQSSRPWAMSSLLTRPLRHLHGALGFRD